MMHRTTPRGRTAVVVIATTLALLAGAGQAAATSSDRGSAGDRPEQVLERDMRGEEAIQALGDRLPEVAAANGMSPAEFRAELREHHDLWVGRTGILLYVDDLHVETSTGPESAAVAEAPLADTFVLHSRPGADRVVFLDFDGHDVSDTAWDQRSNNTLAAPYSQDGDPTTFNDSERAEIQSVWRRIAEDFAPFDVDVTTEDPGSDAIHRSGSSDSLFGTRLVVTPSTDVYPCSCGGVAYVGIFDLVDNTYYQPAFVFTAGVGNGAKNIAEAGSHEIGHNLGLSHDGTSSSGYYGGHGDWAPIMGVGYYEPISQWSRGEYDAANEHEDDFVVMQQHGAPLMVDDHDSTGSTSLTGPDASISGLIHDASDVDAFTFTTTGGTVDLTVAPAPTSPNLDIELGLQQTGTTIALDDPASSASSGNDSSVGLDASISTSLAAGTYVVSIDGVGYGDPLVDGYTDYGSVGRYTLTASFPVDDSGTTTNTAPTAVATPTTATEGDAPLSVTMNASSSSDPEGDALAYDWQVDGVTFSTAELTSHVFETAGTYTVTLVVSDGSLTGSDSFTVNASEPTTDDSAPPAAPSGLTATASSTAVSLTWSDNADNETSFEIERERQHHRNGKWLDTMTYTQVADATGYTDGSVSAETYRYRLRAVNTAGVSTWTSWVTVTVSGSGDGGGGGGGGSGKCHPVRGC